jgi:hypothetical protein
MMTTNPKRQPKGQTNGGEFAPSQNPEAKVDLEVELSDAETAIIMDRVEDLPNPDAIGTSEYRLVYDHLHDVLERVDRDDFGDQDRIELAITSLDEMESEIRSIRTRLTRGTSLDKQAPGPMRTRDEANFWLHTDLSEAEWKESIRLLYNQGHIGEVVDEIIARRAKDAS